MTAAAIMHLEGLVHETYQGVFSVRFVLVVGFCTIKVFFISNNGTVRQALTLGLTYFNVGLPNGSQFLSGKACNRNVRYFP
jgi:hypothetical protein